MAEMTIEQQRVLAIAAARLRLQEPQEPETTGAGIAKEVGKGVVRGVSDVGMTIGSGIANILDPTGFLGAKKGVEALAAPSRSLVQPTPATETERFAGTTAEIGASALTGGGYKAPIMTALSALGGAAGEQVAGEPGKVIGSLVAPATSLAKAPLKGTARWLMQSAMKPTTKDALTGKAARAADTLLDEGINVTPAGMQTLSTRTRDLEGKIQEVLRNSPQTIDKQKTADQLKGLLKEVEQNFNAVENIADVNKVIDKLKNHPLLQGTDEIPLSLANKFKQSIYKELGDAKYGKGVKTGSEEFGEKVLARLLKEGVGKAEPSVVPMMDEQSKLMNALNVSERRALLELNKDPGGMMFLANNPGAAAGFMGARSALFKSILARMINTTQKPLTPTGTAASVGAAAATQGQE